MTTTVAIPTSGKPFNNQATSEQANILRTSAEPCQTDAKLIAQNDRYAVELTIPCNHLIMLEITPVNDLTSPYLGVDSSEFYGMG